MKMKELRAELLKLLRIRMTESHQGACWPALLSLVSGVQVPQVLQIAHFLVVH